MIRNIYVGENYNRKVVTPLITTDQNSYKIIWDTRCKNGVFKITAVKADNSAVFDFGELSDEGVATYVIANNMYDTEGPLKLFLAIVEQDSITTCREINFTVKEGADEASLAENNVNPINNLAMLVSANSNENNTKIENLKEYGLTDVYILKEGEDIIVSENIVTGFLNHNYSQYETIAFPEGITEINLPDTNLGGDTPLTANKIIMPKSLKSIGSFSFANYARWDEEENLIDSSIVVNVKEFVLNEGLETIERYAFADNIYLEKVNIPRSLKIIERGVFEYSDSLKEIFIPATVTEIGDANFNSSTFKQEESTIIYGYAGSVAEHYAQNENFLKEYANTFVNIGSDYSDKVDKEDGKGLSTNDYTNAEKEKLADLKNYDDTQIKSDINNKANKDELNLKLYGTTDVHILTDDDIWITEDGIFEAQKRQLIEHDVVIIPYGVRHILPRKPIVDYENNVCYWEDGVYPIWIEAKKIICPSTLVNIYGSTGFWDQIGNGRISNDIKISGDFVLNEGVEIINLINDWTVENASEIGNITIPITLKTFTVSRYYHDIVIPNNVDKFSLTVPVEFSCHLYVYNPAFDFSDFYISDDASGSGSGVVHGYGGSTAEAFAKEHNIPFVNIGSDYSKQIEELQNAINSIGKETWTITLTDGAIIEKEVAVYD